MLCSEEVDGEIVRPMNMTIRNKLILGCGALTVVTLILAAAAYRTIVVIDRAADEIERKNTEIKLSQILGKSEMQGSAAVRGYLLTDDPGTLEVYRSAELTWRQAESELPQLVRSGEGQRLHAELQRAHQDYRELLAQEIQLQQEKKTREAVALMRSQSNAKFQAVEHALNELLDHLEKTKRAFDQEQDADVANAKWIIVILCGVGVALGLLVAWRISRSVTVPIAAMIATIEQLASNNLTAQDLRVTRDEIGGAGRALNQMKARLGEMIQSIANTAEHLADASCELSSVAGEQASSAGKQQDQTVQVATALQEMSSTVQQVSENSSRAAEASRRAAETARNGGAIVDETLAKMQAIAESVQGTAKRVEALGKSSDQIGRIVAVINDIADQTNLLALNAAIEAARAGAQGRGFAVVADEVRKLAERTTMATKEIANMIEAVQSETRLAVGAMDNGTKQVQQGVETTGKAGSALKEIIQMSEVVGEMVMQIATAATQQSTATEEINCAMERIATLSRESAAAAHQSAEASQNLSGLAQDLQKVVTTFKLDESRRSSRQTRPSGDAGAEPKKALAAHAG